MRSLLSTAFALIFLLGRICNAAAIHTVAIDSDGRDELQISNGTLVVQHRSWALPGNLVVDGVNKPIGAMIAGALSYFCCVQGGIV